MISLNSINKSFRDRVLFRDLNFQIRSNERIGIIGPNGSGKTTLFRIILREESVDSGTVDIPKGTTIGHVAQEVEQISGTTVLSEVMSVFPLIFRFEEEIFHITEQLRHHPHDEKLITQLGKLQDEMESSGGYNLENRAKVILSGLGFKEKDFNRLTDELSGGWKMRIALAKVLLRSPRLLLLDEPTNHLDLESLIWLEKFLKEYDGAILIISHDRYFLDNLVTRIGEIEFGRITTYAGNYSHFEKEKQKNIEILTRQAKNQSRQIAQTERFIERFRAKNTLATRVKSKIRQLEKMERIEAPESSNRQIHLVFPQPRRSGLRVMELKNVRQAYGPMVVYENLNFTLEREEKVALVGPNGAGKSTLLKLMAGRIPHQSGTIRAGHNVGIAYYAQHQLDVLDPNLTVYDTLLGHSEGMTQTQLRTFLGAFLFSGEDVEKKVSVLSGGEKARLVLAKMLLKPANLMLLDEPTNHLDIPSQDILIRAMQDYPGTMVCISHDRRFLNAVCNKVVEVDNGRLREFPGNYDYYLWKREQNTEAQPENDLPAQTEKKESYAERKSRMRAEQKRQRQIRKFEDEIASIEENIRRLHAQMNDPANATNPAKLQSLIDETAAAQSRLDEVMEAWLLLQESSPES